MAKMHRWRHVPDADVQTPTQPLDLQCHFTFPGTSCKIEFRPTRSSSAGSWPHHSRTKPCGQILALYGSDVALYGFDDTLHQWPLQSPCGHDIALVPAFRVVFDGEGGRRSERNREWRHGTGKAQSRSCSSPAKSRLPVCHQCCIPATERGSANVLLRSTLPFTGRHRMRLGSDSRGPLNTIWLTNDLNFHQV